MPFKSQAQRGFLFANKPEIEKRFAAETPKGAKLPEYASDRKKRARKHAGTVGKMLRGY